MAYPFIYHPTFKELLEQLADLGIKTATRTNTVLSPNLSEVEVIILMREVGEDVYSMALNYPSDHERVSAAVLRNVYRRLRLRPEEFGFDAGMEASMGFAEEDGIA